ncbi:MAG TPA: nuclease-related domain-containing protein [Ureibacillus sp.]|nr:nuclease-related domain-containing protein [Ureibacillus sp.]
MILKPFEPSTLSRGQIALKNRLPEHHAKYHVILDDLRRQEAGDKGEGQVMKLLSSNALPENTAILHNISLDAHFQTQIDILILGSSWCLILEVKNIKGVLYFTANPRQMVRLLEDGREEKLGSPESQIEYYSMGLRSLLNEMNLPTIPIYGAVVFAFQNSLVKSPPTKTKALIGRELISYIWSLPNNEQLIDPIKVGSQILKHVKPISPFPLCNRYGIDSMHLISGVECPSCGTFPMHKTLRTWYCPKCEQTNMAAHQHALNDYYMLINNTISINEAIKFLHLRNRYEAYRILKSTCAKQLGNSRSSRYEIK